MPGELIARHTPVSAAVAMAMAAGGLQRLPADLVVAVTGVAGPACDEDGNPVGLVHLACARRAGSSRHVEHRFDPNSAGPIKARMIGASLDLLWESLSA